MSTTAALPWGGDTVRPHVRVVVFVLALIFIASAVRNIKEDGDFRGYLEVGELVLQGRDIYAEARPDVNTWPPLFAVLCVPFALLARVSVYLARAVWLLINAYLVVAMLRITVELVYHRRLALDPARGVSIASAAVLGPLVLASRFFLGNFDRLQINLFILFCCLAGCLLLARRRAVAGGALLGFAAAVKVLPVFFVPYLLAKRWWRALGAALVTGAVATAAPIVVFGPARWWAYVRQWLDIAAGGWPVRKGNQSVYAMIDRLYSHEVVTFSDEVKRLRASDDPFVAALVYGSLAVIVVVFLWAARRGGRDPASPPATVEYAIVLALAVLFSPLAWKHYFVFLFLGYAVLWRAVFEPDAPAAPPPSPVASSTGDDPASAVRAPRLDARTRRGLAIALLLSFALTTLTVRGIVGKTASLTFETLSAVTLGALVALAALLVLRARLSAAGG